MNRRETRVITAFLNCVKSGEFTEDYAIVLIEDTQKYGWLSDEAKDYFYEELENLHPEPEEESEPVEDPEEHEAEQGEGE